MALPLVRAVVQSSQKMTSKLGSHCEPLLLIRGRLIEKTRPRIVDAVTDHAFASLRKHGYYYPRTLELLRRIEENSGEFQQDENVWNTLLTFLHYLDEEGAATNKAPTSAEQIMDVFLIKINRALGY